MFVWRVVTPLPERTICVHIWQEIHHQKNTIVYAFLELYKFPSENNTFLNMFFFFKHGPEKPEKPEKPEIHEKPEKPEIMDFQAFQAF